MLSLTKIGNLKIGLVSKGRPIATERILVTKATKNNQENFTIYPGFNPEGENELEVKLPFNDPELNFEVSYTSFGKIGEDNYLFKAKDFGEKVYAIPYEKEELLTFDMGVLNEELQKKLKMEKTGFLRVMVPGVSGYGEVFFFKTKSVNTIAAIQSELKILHTLMGGLYDLPLVIKPIKKDTEEGSFVFMSISLKDSSSEFIAEYLEKSEKIHKRVKKLEKLYKKEREFIATVYNLGDAIIFIDNDNDQEYVNKNIKVDKNQEYLEAFVQKHKISLPIASLKALLSVSTKKTFEDFILNTEDLDTVSLMKEVARLSSGEKPEAKKETSVTEEKKPEAGEVKVKRGRGRPKKNPEAEKKEDK